MKIPYGWVMQGPYDWTAGRSCKELEEALYAETHCICKLKVFKPWLGHQLKIWWRTNEIIEEHKPHIFARFFTHIWRDVEDGHLAQPKKETKEKELRRGGGYGQPERCFQAEKK